VVPCPDGKWCCSSDLSSGAGTDCCDNSFSLALGDLIVQPSTSPSSSSSTTKPSSSPTSSSNTPACPKNKANVVGASVGATLGVALLAALVALVVLQRKLQHLTRARTIQEPGYVSERVATDSYGRGVSAVPEIDGTQRSELPEGAH